MFNVWIRFNKKSLVKQSVPKKYQILSSKEYYVPIHFNAALADIEVTKFLLEWRMNYGPRVAIVVVVSQGVAAWVR